MTERTATSCLLHSIRSFVVCCICFSTLCSRSAFAYDLDFYNQCRRFLPIADDFGAECLQKARPFGREFYPTGMNRGVPERFSAYFKPLEAPSHFLLGCVLNIAHQISFAGMYYSHERIDMQDFDRYPITFIDYNANVGIDIGGSQLTLLAIRQFSTSKIPPHIKGERINCENERIEFFNSENPTYYSVRYKYLGDNILQPISSLGELFPNITVKQYFGEHRSPLIFADFTQEIFIERWRVYARRKSVPAGAMY
jgi:hypothetical protein